MERILLLVARSFCEVNEDFDVCLKACTRMAVSRGEVIHYFSYFLQILSATIIGDKYNLKRS